MARGGENGGEGDSADEFAADRGLFVYEFDGWTILAGRSNTDNDRLSLRIARPDDWWFHVRSMPGSHVVLRAREGEEPGRAVLDAAAAVAAYHSKARSGGNVAVSCTRGKFVSKPRGAPPGTVTIRKERVLQVRPSVPDR